MQKNFQMRKNLFRVEPSDVKLTEENAAKSLNLSDSQTHRVIFLFSDGIYFSKDINQKDVYKAIAYNAVYRYNTSIIVDGILVRVSDDSRESDVERYLSLIAQKMPLIKGSRYCTPCYC